MTIYETALAYRKFGFSIFPLIPKDKKPLIAWKKYQTSIASDDELKAWFFGTQNGIGIVTGELSNLIVLDADCEETAKWAELKGIEPGIRVKTAKGVHFYLRWAEGFRNAVHLKDLGGLDIRGEGGYVAAPPTIHPTGVRYEFIKGMPKSIPEAPEWLLESLEMGLTQATPESKTPMAEIVGGRQTGDRNHSLARFIGVVVKMVDFEQSLEVALNWNRTNQPPLPTDEVIETVKSIWKREQNKLDQTAPTPNDLILGGQALYDRTTAYLEKGEEPALSTGWFSVDEFYRVRKKEWTLITGIPGAGKTVWLDNLCINMAKKFDWKIAMFSAENVPHERHALALEELLGGKNDVNRNFVSKHFTFLSPNEDNLTVEKLLAMCDTLAATNPFDALVIDPWNELDHMKRGNISETEHVSAALTRIRRYARMKNIHVWLIAHPTKLHKLEGTNRYPVPTPYDVSGSAHFRNKADNCLSLWWDYDNKSFETEIHIQKIRFRECGQLGMVKLQHMPDGRYV